MEELNKEFNPMEEIDELKVPVGQYGRYWKKSIGNRQQRKIIDYADSVLEYLPLKGVLYEEDKTDPTRRNGPVIIIKPGVKKQEDK